MISHAKNIFLTSAFYKKLHLFKSWPSRFMYLTLRLMFPLKAYVETVTAYSCNLMFCQTECRHWVDSSKNNMLKLLLKAKLRSTSWWIRYFVQNNLEENEAAIKKFEQAATKRSYIPNCQIFHLKSFHWHVFPPQVIWLTSWLSSVSYTEASRCSQIMISIHYFVC